jgi:hypothetical protein
MRGALSISVLGENHVQGDEEQLRAENLSQQIGMKGRGSQHP